MTDKNYTHLLVVADRSGSMSWSAIGMQEALTSVFSEQAELEGKCLVDYVQFDTVIETVFEDVPAKEAKAVIQPRGGTALLDAVGASVVTLGSKLAKMKEANRPGTVMVIVVTDGYENSSTKWTAPQIKALIAEQESKYNWDFTFLGANLDAVAVGESFGFKGDKSLTYTQGNEAVMAQSLNAYASMTRSGLQSSYSDEDRLKNATK